MSKTKKKSILIIGVVVFAILSFVFFLVFSAFKTEKSISLKDSQGDIFAYIEWDGVSESFVSEDEYAKAYACTAFNEALKIIEEQQKDADGDIKDYFFKNVTEITTNYDKEFSLRLNEAFQKNNMQDFSCEMAVTDLNGRLIAVFSAGNEEAPYSVSNNYVGSTIKPLSVFAPAIETGMFNWSSMIEDAPVSQIQNESGEYTDWPVNANNEYTYEKMSLADALLNSTNTVAVRLLKGVGVTKVIDTLEYKYGFDLEYEKQKVKSTDETEVLGNIALGYLYKGASVIDMAGCFQPFANGGFYNKPMAVDEIFNGETSLYKAEYENQQVISDSTAEIVNKMLQNVVGGGTGKDAYVPGIRVGGKTGTTSGNKDNWFVGFTPEYSCAVWHSFSEKGNIAPEIFASVFENLETVENSYPHCDEVISKPYCNVSGKLRGTNCKMINRGYYTENKLPAVCDECK